MAQGDLELSLLHQIMIRLGELREHRNAWNPVSEGDLFDLVRAANGMKALNHLQRHVDYLSERRLLTIPSAGGTYRNLKLTAKGQSYVQPELAEFAEKPMLPDVVKSLENKIAVLTYPEPEKASMIQSLRQAVADKAPELIAKVLVELGAKIGGL
jgi:hypothetical protein